MLQELTAELVRRGELERVLSDWTAPFPGFHLCYSDQRQMSPGMRALVETLRDQAGRMAAASL